MGSWSREWLRLVGGDGGRGELLHGPRGAGAGFGDAHPCAHGTTLTGTAVALPDALKGKVGVLVVGFSHASQGQVASWGRLLEADYGKSRTMWRISSCRCSAGAPKMLRGMIVKSMAKSVPEAEKPHFLPLMEDEPAWRAVAHYDKPDDAYVLLVDGDGHGACGRSRAMRRMRPMAS